MIIIKKREAIFKWLGYGAYLLLAHILETMLFSRFAIFGVIPIIIPVTVAIVAVLEGPEGGAGFGLAAGLLTDAVAPGAGFYTIVLTLFGIIIGNASRFVFSKTFPTALLASLVLLIVLSVGSFAISFAENRAGITALWTVSAPEVAYSLLFCPPLYFLMKRISLRFRSVSSEASSGT